MKHKVYIDSSSMYFKDEHSQRFSINVSFDDDYENVKEFFNNLGIETEVEH